MFERFVAIRMKTEAKFVEEGYRRGEAMGQAAMQKMCRKLRICTRARITPEWLEETINRSELLLGERPLVVIVDYLGLMRGEGRSRYEQFSNIVEELRIIAKTTRTVILATSQVTRDKKRGTPEITLHDAKESGSIENSSSLVLGSWRDAEDDTALHLRVLKNTKGRVGWNVECDFDGPSLRIKERSGGYPKKKEEESGKLVRVREKIGPEDADWTNRLP
jgi:replicative DNA helicase